MPKFKHMMYEWLGVDKVELAVTAELLLRGEQTLGELRGRAARMEPIADLGALRPIIQSLIEKGLVVALTPEGRGQVAFIHDDIALHLVRSAKADRPAVSLHLYARPFDACNCYCPETGEVTRKELTNYSVRGELVAQGV